MRSRSPILVPVSILVCALVCGCGNDEDFDRGDPRNFPVINPGLVFPPAPGNPNPMAPVVTLDSGFLSSARGSAALAFAPGATVTDADSVNFNGGTLTITAGLNGNNQGLFLNAPGTPNIGTITGNGTGTLIVSLNQNATPANVQQFLRGVTFNTDNTANFGANVITVGLTDGTGQTADTTFRPINVTGGGALNLTVGQGGLTTVQSAVDLVASTPNAQGSRIVVPSGNFNETVNISNDPDLAGLTLVGPNAGISAGVTPGNRGAEASLTRLSVNSPNVTVQGLTLSEGATVPLSDSAAVFLGAQASNFSALENRFVRTGPPGAFRGIVNAVGTTNGNTRIANNLFQGFGTGVFLQGPSAANPIAGSQLAGNAFIGNTVGLSLDNAQNTQITGNGFRNQTLEHLGALNPGNTVVASGNDFDNSASLNVITGGAGDTAFFDARNNFFGPTGPATPGNNPRVNTTGAGTFNVQTSPFLTTDPFPSF